MTCTALAITGDLTTSRGLACHYATVHARLMQAPEAKPILRVVAPEQPDMGDLVGDGCPLNMLAAPSWRFLVAVVAARSGVGIRDILGRSRIPHIVSARHDAIALVYSHGNRSLPKMGRLFGLDHSTILYVIKKRGAGKLSSRSAIQAQRRARPIKAPATPLNHAVVAGYLAGKPVKVIASETGSPSGSIRAMASLMGIRHPNARRPQLPRKSGDGDHLAALASCNTKQEHPPLSTQFTG